jgi:Dual specificity phosphatase, catalytic domain.
MEHNSDERKIFHYRKSLTIASNRDFLKEDNRKISNLDLFSKILNHLPESEQKQFRKSETLENQTAQPTEYNEKRTLKHYSKTTIDPESRIRSFSDELYGLKKKNHGDTLFEVSLKDLNLSDCSDQISSPKLFIGDNEEANNCSILLAHSIQGIVTIGEMNNPGKFPSISSGYFMVPLFHQSFVREAVKAVKKPLDVMLSKGNVLIHCSDGHLFAPVVAIGYLVKRFQISFDDAKERVCCNRPSIVIPRNFEKEIGCLVRTIY